MSNFLNQFSFRQNGTLPLGAEEEFWTLRPDGSLFGASPILFGPLGHQLVVRPDRRDGFPPSKLLPELPIHQIESVTGICDDSGQLADQLQQNRDELARLASKNNFQLSTSPTAPAEVNVVVYPKPRYLEIHRQIPADTLRYAWIAGLHVHLGVSDWDQAIRLFNGLREWLPFLLALSIQSRSCSSHGRSERFFIYQQLMTKLKGEFIPPQLKSASHFEELAHRQNFAADPKKCWWLMRINPVGTVEIRVSDMQVEAEHSAQIAAAARMLATVILRNGRYGLAPNDYTLRCNLASVAGGSQVCRTHNKLDDLHQVASRSGMPEEAELIAALRGRICQSLT